MGKALEPACVQGCDHFIPLYLMANGRYLEFGETRSETQLGVRKRAQTA